jgi:hypothetical protein
MGVIVLGLMNFDENLINQFDITLELSNMRVKSSSFFRCKTSNVVTYDPFNVECNENCIITNYIFYLISQECIIHITLPFLML